MEIIPMLLKEMEQEAQTTRKMLERVPEDKFLWQPHPKSMTMQRLASHVAELPGWVHMALTTDALNLMQSEFKPVLANNRTELLEMHEKAYIQGREQLEKADEELLKKNWQMRGGANGEELWYEAPKGDVIRMSFSQTVHHRAQLGVFLRLLDIPIPGSYGPSADEH